MKKSEVIKHYYTAEQKKDGRYALFLYLFLEDEIVVYENLYHREITRNQAAFLRSRYFNRSPFAQIQTDEWGFLESYPKEVI